MKNEKEPKKVITISLGKFVTILICLVLVMFIAVSIYENSMGRPNAISAIQALFKKNAKNTVESVNNTNANENVANDENQTVNGELTSSKINTNKEWVYDANYQDTSLSGKSYFSKNLQKTYSLDDIVVPYININSSDATQANNEIKNIYKELEQSFKEELNDTQIWYTISSYKTYTSGDILSVIITIETGGSAPEQYKYYAYNFNLKTLNKVTYEQAYNYAGFKQSTLEQYVKQDISKAKIMTDYSNNTGDNINQYVDESMNNYKQSCENKTIQFFIDNNSKLNIVVTLALPMDSGEFPTIVSISK